MKKTYSKPQIVFESFELTTSIAAGCVQIVTKEEYEADKALGVFTADCLLLVPCYHVPDGNGVFMS